MERTTHFFRAVPTWLPLGTWTSLKTGIITRLMVIIYLGYVTCDLGYVIIFDIGYVIICDLGYIIICDLLSW